MLGRPRAAAYVGQEGYLGATVGRYANRIGGASFELDGEEYRLRPVDRGHTLHGGPGGFDTRTWILVDKGVRHAEMALVSPDGDQGFPGTLTVRARFEVVGPELRTSYVATTDAPTHVSLTSHAYYDLDGTGPDDLWLTVHADHVLPLDDTGLPTGELRPVDGTAFDLRGPTRLGDVLCTPELAATSGFDHGFVLRGSGMRTVAVLEGRDLRLEIDTDQPGLQVFTGAGAIPGVALEPQHHPDSPHHPEWPSTVLRPGEVYRWASVVRVLPVGAGVAL